MREFVDVAPVRLQRAIAGIGLLVEIARDQQRLTAQRFVLRLGGEPLVLLGGARQLSTLPVGVGDLFAGFEAHLVLGVGTAEGFEHLRRRRPVLQPDQRGAGVVLGRRADGGGGRCGANPQEVVGRRAIVLHLVCGLSLLVDRGGEVVDEAGARLVVLRRRRQDLRVGVLGLRVLGELERAVRHDDPRGAPDAGFSAGIGVDDALGGRDGGGVVLHLVQVVGGRSQDRGGLFVLRERVGEFDRAGDCIVLDDVQLRLVRDLQLLAVGVDRGVPRGRRLRMRRVFVSRALVLLGRLAEILVLQEQVGEPVVDGRRLGVLREGLEVVLVPAESLAVVCVLLVRQILVLILGVIMGREVLQVGLQVAQYLR